VPLQIPTVFTELGNRRSKFGVLSQHNACGTLYLDLGVSDKALEHFRAAVHLSRERGQVANEVNALMSVGVSLEQVGNFTGAADAYRRAIELLEREYETSGMLEKLSAKAATLTLLAGAFFTTRSMSRWRPLRLTKPPSRYTGSWAKPTACGNPYWVWPACAGGWGT
jgi:tetratricopeptide (TPR) repeat protein